MARLLTVCVGIALLGMVSGGCPTATTGGANPFLTYAENFSSNVLAQTDEQASGQTVDVPFRRSMTLTLANNHSTADANVSFAAWVNVSSIRSAEQQDALFNSGYVQLTREARIGDVYRLPVGTFVYNGPGNAGTTPLVIPPARSASTQDPTDETGGGTTTTTPTIRTFQFVTPDVVLVYSQPPVSCDTVAFYFTREGQVISEANADGRETAVFFGATGLGGYKTLVQVEGYQCNPFRPGFHLKIGGGARTADEFIEGQDVRVDFNEAPNAAGKFATVTFSG